MAKSNAQQANAQIAMTEDEALNLVAYLTASADISLREPELYGPFRLIEAASQVAEAVLKNNPRPESRAFWESLQQEINTKSSWMMWDKAGFREFLQEMPGKVAEELKKNEQS